MPAVRVRGECMGATDAARVVSLSDLRRLLADLDGACAVIDLDMGGVDPGVGSVVPLPITHAQLRCMALLLLYTPHHTDAEFNELQARYDALVDRVRGAIDQLHTPPP